MKQETSLTTNFSPAAKKLLLVTAVATAALLEGCAGVGGLNNGIGGYPNTQRGYGSSQVNTDTSFCTTPRLLYPDNAEYVQRAREAATSCLNDMQAATNMMQNKHQDCDRNTASANGMQNAARSLMRNDVIGLVGTVINSVGTNPQATTCHNNVDNEFARYKQQYEINYQNRVQGLATSFGISSQRPVYQNNQGNTSYGSDNYSHPSYQQQNTGTDPVSVCKQRYAQKQGKLLAGDACWAYLR